MVLRAVYPGSFDPFTTGHYDILERTHRLFQTITVLVARAPAKTHWFSSDERVELIQEVIRPLKNVMVESFEGLTVDFAVKSDAKVIIRGLRAVSDFEHEMSMATINRRLAPHLETMIVFSKPEYNDISSRMVKEVAFHGGDISGLVHPSVAGALRSRSKIFTTPNSRC